MSHSKVLHTISLLFPASPTTTTNYQQLPLCQPQKDDITTGLPRRMHRLRAIGNQIRWVSYRLTSCPVNLLLALDSRFLRRLQKSIQRRVHSDSEELDPANNATTPLLAESPPMPMKMQKSNSATQFKLNRQPRVAQYHSLDASCLITGSTVQDAT